MENIASRNGDSGIYVTLNTVDPALLARAANRLKSRASTTTSDKDIVGRRWLPLDLDPVRPTAISSTEQEHEAALERACSIRFDLTGEGWSAPILGDSGNGAYLLYPIDLPNDDATTQLVQAVLKALAARFDDNVVKVDPTVFNAGRIVKCFGTTARKGDFTLERPHRLSRLLDIPDRFQPVPRQLLERLADRLGQPPPPSPAMQLRGWVSVEEWIRRYGLAVHEPVPYDGGRKWVLDCPFNPEHKSPDAAIFETADGTRGDREGPWAELLVSCIGSSRSWDGPRPNAMFSPGRPLSEHFSSELDLTTRRGTGRSCRSGVLVSTPVLSLPAPALPAGASPIRRFSLQVL
jgi:hypothetical protein